MLRSSKICLILFETQVHPMLYLCWMSYALGYARQWGRLSPRAVPATASFTNSSAGYSCSGADKTAKVCLHWLFWRLRSFWPLRSMNCLKWNRYAQIQHICVCCCDLRGCNVTHNLWNSSSSMSQHPSLPLWVSSLPSICLCCCRLFVL